MMNMASSLRVGGDGGWKTWLTMLGLALMAMVPATAQSTSPQKAAEAAVKGFLKTAAAGDVDGLEKAAQAVIAVRAEALPLLEEGLHKRKPHEIVAILRLMRRMRAPGAAGTVLDLAAHRAAAVRAEVLVFCTLLDVPEIVPHLYRGTRDESVDVRRRAYDGLLKFEPRDQNALMAAVQGLFSRDFWIVGQAARFLATWPRPENGVDPLVRALGDKIRALDVLSAAPVFAILSKRMGDEVLPLVLRGMKSSKDVVALQAIKTAVNLKLKGAHGELQQLCQGRGEAAVAATRALGTLKVWKATPTLVKRLSLTTNKKHREAIAVALRRITGKAFGYDSSKWEIFLSEEF